VTTPVSRYPGIAEYNQAVQNAAVAFADPVLKTGRLATNALGLPIVLGGGFALTYTVTANGSKTRAQKFAVRCLSRTSSSAMRSSPRRSARSEVRTSSPSSTSATACR
jgi:hypothetical protein